MEANKRNTGLSRTKGQQGLGLTSSNVTISHKTSIMCCLDCNMLLAMLVGVDEFPKFVAIAHTARTLLEACDRVRLLLAPLM